MPPFFVGNIEEMRKIFEGLDGTLWTAFLVALHDYIEVIQPVSGSFPIAQSLLVLVALAAD